MKKTTDLQESDLRRIIHKTVKTALHEMYEHRIDEVRNFNNVIRDTKQRINESNINRMLQWLKDCDCAFISAFRSELKDIRDKKSTYLGPDKDWEEGKRFTHEENRQKNKMMVTELLQLGYGVTKIKGVYPEGMTDESSEESYLVVNRDDDSNFLDNLLRIAEYYNQDSIYYKEKGKTKGNLIGTNSCEVPGWHQKGEDNELHIDTASNYMSRMGNKAFSFVGDDAEKVGSREEAMDSIERSRGTDDEWNQRYWRDNDGTSFGGRKNNRKRNIGEALDFWRNMVAGRMLIKEDIHPLTRKVMGEALRSMRR